ncbi:MAG TPA: BON domain-containing protein [Caulobacteraceae bacterium]
MLPCSRLRVSITVAITASARGEGWSEANTPRHSDPAPDFETLERDLGPSSDRSQIRGGKVKLTGTVRSQHERKMAAAAAWAAEGVTDVENDLAIE